MRRMGTKGLLSLSLAFLLCFGLLAVFGCSEQTRTIDGSKCHECGSAEVIPIVYGLPGEEMMELSQRGEIILGG